MVRLSSLAAAVSWLQLSSAWLPSERPEGTLNKKWLPGSGKIRGVNLGSLFVFEPWIANSAWTGLGCEDSPDRGSEFDCVSKLGQEQADAAFQGHWGSFITESDLDEMKRYGINTIRIPLGYWLDRSLVDSSENFPQGAEEYLVRICGWATARGLYIILDPGFYNEYNYGRGVKFLQYLTKLAHERPEMENVGMIEVLNEPVHWDQSVESLRSTFYRDAYNAIRQVERDLNVSPDDQFHIQMMGSGWGAGNPVEFLSDTQLTAFDDHRYLKWANRDEVPLSHESFISTSCSDNLSRDSAGPTIIGEWSLSVPDDVQWSDGWHPESQKDFYRKWFAAQIHSYETRAEGWVFWTWKTQLGDYRWGYKDAVAAGVIPENIDEALNSGNNSSSVTASYATLSFHKNDHVCFTNFAEPLARGAEAILAASWPPGIKKETSSAGLLTYQVKGRPWDPSDDASAIAACRLVRDLLAYLHRHGWTLVTGLGHSVRMWTKDSLVFRRGAASTSARQRFWLAVSFAKSDKLRLDCAERTVQERTVDAVREVMTRMGYVAGGTWNCDAYEFRLKDKPWNANMDGGLRPRMLVLGVLEALEGVGWQSYGAVAQRTKVENTQKADIWYFSKEVGVPAREAAWGSRNPYARGDVGG
ncbi:hypothetical protein ACHAPP_003264 [Verticillium nonalfalfae]